MGLGELLRHKPTPEQQERAEAREEFSRIRQLAPQFSDGSVVFNSVTIASSIVASATGRGGLPHFLLDTTGLERGDQTRIFFPKSTERVRGIDIKRVGKNTDLTEIRFDPVSFAFRELCTSRKGIYSLVRAGDQDLLNNLLRLIKEDLETGRNEWITQLRTTREAFFRTIQEQSGLPNGAAVVDDFVRRTSRTFRDRPFVVFGFPLQVQEKEGGEKPEEETERHIDSTLQLYINAHMREEQAQDLASGGGSHGDSRTYTRDMGNIEGTYIEECDSGFNRLSIRLDVYEPQLTGKHTNETNADYRMQPMERMFYAFMDGDRNPQFGIYKDSGEFLPATLLWAEPNTTPVGPLFE